MAVDVLFTNGVIAAKEKFLLKDKILRLCEMSADDAFRMLLESGFGGAEATSVYEYEKLVAADERAIDDFVREYAPTEADLCYLLSPRDFHNAKAMVKAGYLGTDAEKMLAPDGRISVEQMRTCFRTEDFAPLGEELSAAIVQAREYLKEGDSGAEVGAIFERAQYAHLASACRKNRLLKKLVAAKADRTNILTALRSSCAENAAKGYVEGGNLTSAQLDKLFEGEEAACRAFAGSEVEPFVRRCLAAKRERLPLTESERERDSYDCDYLAANRYELKANQPFLYYVFRRRAENENVRIVFVCLLGGMSERDIKKRLRGV